MDGYITIGTELNTSRFDKQIDLLEDKLEGLEQEYDVLEKAKPFEGQNKELIKLGNEIDTTKRKIAKMRKEKEKIDNQGFANLNASLNNIGNSMSGIIKKVAKWGLAIFGVRSAYLAIRQAMSTLSQYDENMKANIDYIRFALATVLKPIIEWIINAVYKVLSYINYIANAWFGVNLFANASAKAFGSANKNAQKLQKTMASFDEMNVLSDNRSATDTTGAPSFDLSKMQDVQIPDWIKWIADNKDTILNVAKIAAAIFGAKVITSWIKNLGTFMGAKGLGLLGTKLGALATMAGSVIITALVAKKVWDEAAQLKKELEEIGRKGQEKQKEWINNETDINKLITTGNVNRTAANKLLDKSGGIWNWINGLGEANLRNAQRTSENISEQINKEIELYKKKVAAEGVTEENKKLEQQIKDNIIQQIEYNNKLIQKLHENGYETQGIERLNQNLIQNYKDMGGNVENISDELNGINKIKFDDKTIKITGDTQSLMSKVRELEQRLQKARDYAQQLAGGLGFSSFGGGGGSIGGGSFGGRAKGGIYYPSMLPKLAVGGIINNPGPGVPYHGAYIGERGAEAVVPLTDSQQMELLGSTIGKYISINLTNITELDGRQIARKVEQINNNNNFVLNR